MYDNSGVIKRRTPSTSSSESMNCGAKTENFSCFCCCDDDIGGAGPGGGPSLRAHMQHRKSWYKMYDLLSTDWTFLYSLSALLFLFALFINLCMYGRTDGHVSTTCVFSGSVSYACSFLDGRMNHLWIIVCLLVNYTAATTTTITTLINGISLNHLLWLQSLTIFFSI